MLQDELISVSVEKMDDLISRFGAVTSDLSVERMNTGGTGACLDIGGIIEHMNISNRPYANLISKLAGLGVSSGDEPVKPTFLGGKIAAAAGPKGNAPAPGSMQPKNTGYDETLYADWLALHSEIRDLMGGLGDTDLSQKFPNPFVGFLKMNIVDFLLIVPSHTERHILQLEERKSLI